MAAKRDRSQRKAGLSEASPHYHGHRERLRARFREVGAEAVSDYELLELVLFRASATTSRWHDHIIVSKEGHASFKGLRLI